MPIKYIIVKEIKSGTSKNGTTYPWILDQENIRWNIFPPLPHVEINKAYAFHFEQNGEYSNVKKIEPIINIFKIQQLKETSSRNDYEKYFFMALSYSKDLVVSGKLDIKDLYTKTDEMYQFVENKVNSLMPKEC